MHTPSPTAGTRPPFSCALRSSLRLSAGCSILVLVVISIGLEPTLLAGGAPEPDGPRPVRVDHGRVEGRVRREVRSRIALEGRVVAIVTVRPEAAHPDSARPDILRPDTDCPNSTQPAAARASERVADRVAERLRQVGGSRLRYRCRWVPCVVVDLWEPAACDALDALDGVLSVEEDERGEGALLQSTGYIGADRVHDLGLLGDGITVAVLDTGIDTDHPSFEGAIVHQYHFLGQGKDVGPGAEDDHGHGSHVAGIIASRGIGAPLGIAPGASVVAVKVLDDQNAGWLSDWAAGLDHVISLVEAGTQIDVVNMSLVSNAVYEGSCDNRSPALAAACSEARRRGLVLFAASGNNSSAVGMTVPACYTSTISVGSVLDTAPDSISSFTNRNDILDLLAPGQGISSVAMGGGSRVASGTSQASPHAAAVACILRQLDRSISPEEIREVLRQTGRPLLDARTELVFPILDAAAATEAVGGAAASSPFVRADCSPDGVVDIADPVATLLYLFQGGAAPPCLDACDSDDDGRIDISDAILTLGYLFLGGAPPPEPFPACGLDPSESTMGCVESPCG